MEKYLEYYVRYDRSDAIGIGFVYLDEKGAEVAKGTVPGGSDSALQKAAGAKNWDEDTICSVYSLKRKPEPKNEASAKAAV